MIDWRFQRVVIIGAARQGVALARYLAAHGAEVVLTDRQHADDLGVDCDQFSDYPVECVFGDHPSSLLDRCTLLCPSAGVPLSMPLVIEAQARGIPLSNDSQIFLDAAPCKVIGITGSAGKTTTTTLIGRMAAAAYGAPRAWVGGNIGNPLITELDKMGPDHIAVMELSSFQLEIMTRSPHVAAVLNVTPNHLDRHLSMEAYTNAKAQILRHQTEQDVAVLGRDDPGAWSLRDSVRGDLVTFGKRRPTSRQTGSFLSGEMVSLWERNAVREFFSRDSISLRGEHNLLNVLAACAIAYAAKLPVDAMIEGVSGFTGVEHRLEFVREWGGAAWYNDSIATAPERAMAAIRSFDQPLVLLAGGRDKDLPWRDFSALVRERVDHLIIFGEAREVVARAIGSVPAGERPFSVDVFDRLEDAARAAAKIVETGDVVLLSPGGTSFDEFRDFTERGDWFRTWVNKLP